MVKSISLCYNLTRIETLRENRDSLIEQHLENKGRPPRGSHDDDVEDRFSTIPHKVDFINDSEIVLKKQFGTDSSVLFNVAHFAGKAFISFQYQHFRDYILEKAESSSTFLNYNGSYLHVSKALHPHEIIW